MKIHINQARSKEIEQLEGFFLHHGVNPFNYLPSEAIKLQIQRVIAKTDICLVAVGDKKMLGIAIYRQLGDLPTIFRNYIEQSHCIYLAEIVVHREFNGRGIGTNLIKKIACNAVDEGAHFIVADRHDENLASAGMMKKSGFEVLHSFNDPNRRGTGNRKTTMLALPLR